MGGGVSSSHLKSSGDEALKSRDYHLAIYLYTKAIESTNPEDFQQRSVLFSNRSVAFLEDGLVDRALSDADEVIRLQPSWAKGYFRAAKAQLAVHRLDEAADNLDKALALLPSDSTLFELKQECTRLLSDKPSSRITKLSSLYSWGTGEAGQLGLGSTLSRTIPSAVESLSGKYIKEIACGTVHSIAITFTGEAYAWGDNSFGQLGAKSEQANVDLGKSTWTNSIAFPRIIPKLIGIAIRAVSCGAAHSIALSTDGRSFGWGMAGSGQLGLGAVDKDCKFVKEPTQITYFDSTLIQAVQCGLAHTCLVDSQGRLFCCGLNNFGQLGLGANPPPTSDVSGDAGLLPCLFTPSLVTLRSASVAHVACGGAHTLVIDNDGRLWSCGSNSCGQLGLSTRNDTSQFCLVEQFKRSDETSESSSKELCAFAACGEEYSLVISTRKEVFSFGLGVCGQLGHGDKNDRIAPTQISGLENQRCETVVCSQGQVFATTENGELWTWGLPCDQGSSLFISDSAIMWKPQKFGHFGSRKKVRSIACGRKHSIAVINSAFGPASFIKSVAENAGHVVEAGGRLRFCVQAVDTFGVECRSSAEANCTARVVVESSVVISTTQKQIFRDQQSVYSPGGYCAELDDNFDGTYHGACRFAVAGMYLVRCLLDDLEVRNSPLEVTVRPSSIDAMQSSVWWGKFAATSSSEFDIHASCKDSLLFTVSARDRFGNKWLKEDSAVEDKECPTIVVVVETSSGCVLDRQSFTKSTNGIFPCYFSAPPEAGSFSVSIFLDDDRERLVSRKAYKLSVQSADLLLTTEEAKDTTVVHQSEDTIGDPAASASSEISNCKEEERILQLQKQERTRMRARQALLKVQAEKAQDQQERNKSRNARRTGGGFIIQYSKDI